MRHALCLAALLAAATPALAQPVQLNDEVTLNFRETRLQTVVTAIQKAVRVNLVLDPRVDENASVSAAVSAQPLGKLLDSIQEKLGLERTVWCGAVVLHPKGSSLGSEPPKPTGEGARDLSARVQNVDFAGIPLNEALEKLKERLGEKATFEVLSFPVRKHLRSKGTTIHLKVWDCRARDILNHLARLADLKWALVKKKVVFTVTTSAKAAADETSQVDFDVLRGDTFEGGSKVNVDKLVVQLAVTRSRGAAKQLLIREGAAVCPKVAAKLRKSVAAGDAPTALACLEVLRRVEDPKEYAAVLSVMKNAEVSLEVRAAAGEALGGMKAPEAVPDLIALLDDPWFRVSETARAALVSIGEPSVKPLIDRFKKEWKAKKANEGILYRALLIFGDLNTDLSKQALLWALRSTQGGHDRAIAIRHHAAIGLGFTGDKRLIEPMIAALQREKDFRVGKYLGRSLTWLTGHEGPGTNGDRWKIWWDLEGKKKIMDPRSSKELIDELAGGEVEIPLDEQGLPILETFEQRMARLTKLLGNKDLAKRRAAWRELESLGEKALPALRETVKSGNPQARANARRIIARIEGTEDE
jgi:hypothetical protein